MALKKPASVNARPVRAAFATFALISFSAVAAICAHTECLAGDSAEPFDIKLVGVWPNESADVLDAEGKKVGETLGLAFSWPDCSSESDRIEIERTFIFDISGLTDDVVFSPLPSTTASDTSEEAGTCSSSKILRTPRGVRLYQTISFDERFVNSLSAEQRLLPADKASQAYRGVDYSVAYWKGPRGKAAYTFLGPFKAGETCSAEDQAPGELSVAWDYGVGTGGVSFKFASTRAPAESAQVLIYDASGKRSVLERGPHFFPGVQEDNEFKVEGLGPDGISAITIGEEPLEKTFQNIKVIYPDRPERTYPEYVDEVAARLKVKPKSLIDSPMISSRGHRLLTSADALKVIDVVRGRHIGDTVEAIRPYGGAPDQGPEYDFSRLTDEGREKVRRAAELWSTADDPRIRGEGLALGLAVGFKDFFDRAATELSIADEGSSHSIAATLARRGRKLSAADVPRLKELLLTKDTRAEQSHLLDCLAGCPLPEAASALADLARDERSLVWWSALRSDRTIEALGPRDQWPELIKVRMVIASRFSKSEAARDKNVTAGARKALPGLLTSDLKEADFTGFLGVLGDLIEQCDKDTANRAMVDYLKTAKEWVRDDRAVGSVIRHINYLNKVNIAGLGKDVQKTRMGLRQRNLRQVINEALDWYAGGKGSAGIPADYKAKNGDLRFVAYRKKDPEHSVIGLWIYEEKPKEVRRGHVASSGGTELKYEVEVVSERMAAGRKSVFYSIGFNIDPYEGYGFGVSSVFVWDDELPETVHDFRGWKFVAERANSPKSVLSGTTVFEKWWAKYGPADAAQQYTDEESSGEAPSEDTSSDETSSQENPPDETSSDE